MGAGQSKVSVELPKGVRCFPAFSEECVRQTIEIIEESHAQAVQIASLISSISSPNTAIHFAFSAATILFSFLLQRLPSKGQKDVKYKKSLKNLESCPVEKQDKSLEEALIDAKVSSAIAQQSVSELQAKLQTIKNRYDRLLSSISRKEKRLEVVPAVQTCEEVLFLFSEPSHVFQKHPLIAAPFLVSFTGIFVAVAEFSLALIPSYKSPLIKEMNSLSDTLQAYKLSCINARMESMKLKGVQPVSMIHAVSNGINDFKYRLVDTLSSPTQNTAEGSSQIYEDAKSAISAYREEIKMEYERAFLPALEVVSKFSGYSQELQENSHKFKENSHEFHDARDYACDKTENKENDNENTNSRGDEAEEKENDDEYEDCSDDEAGEKENEDI